MSKRLARPCLIEAILSSSTAERRASAVRRLAEWRVVIALNFAHVRSDPGLNRNGAHGVGHHSRPAALGRARRRARISHGARAANGRTSYPLDRRWRCSRTNGEDGRDAVACPNIARVKWRVWPLVLLSTVCPAGGA